VVVEAHVRLGRRVEEGGRAAKAQQVGRPDGEEIAVQLDRRRQGSARRLEREGGAFALGLHCKGQLRQRGDLGGARQPAAMGQPLLTGKQLAGEPLQQPAAVAHLALVGAVGVDQQRQVERVARHVAQAGARVVEQRAQPLGVHLAQVAGDARVVQRLHPHARQVQLPGVILLAPAEDDLVGPGAVGGGQPPGLQPFGALLARHFVDAVGQQQHPPAGQRVGEVAAGPPLPLVPQEGERVALPLLAEADEKRHAPRLAGQQGARRFEGDLLQRGGLARAGLAQDDEGAMFVDRFRDVLQRLGRDARFGALARLRNAELAEGDRHVQPLDGAPDIHLRGQGDELGRPDLVFALDGQCQEVRALVTAAGQLLSRAGAEGERFAAGLGAQGVAARSVGDEGRPGLQEGQHLVDQPLQVGGTVAVGDGHLVAPDEIGAGDVAGHRRAAARRGPATGWRAFSRGWFRGLAGGSSSWHTSSPRGTMSGQYESSIASSDPGSKQLLPWNSSTLPHPPICVTMMSAAEFLGEGDARASAKNPGPGRIRVPPEL
jgi:hypothetical protein